MNGCKLQQLQSCVFMASCRYPQDLLAKEEENLEHDKEFILKDLNGMKLVTTKAALKRLSMLRADNRRLSMMERSPSGSPLQAPGGWSKGGVTGVNKAMKEQIRNSKMSTAFRADHARHST